MVQCGHAVLQGKRDSVCNCDLATPVKAAST